MNPVFVTRMIARDGAAATLRRLTTTPGTVTDVAVRAVLRGFQGEVLPGDVLQSDRQAIISNAEIAAASWPGPPRKGDQVILGGQTMAVQGCDTRRVGDAIAMHILTVRGS